jgi:dolichyl-phosphate-mannose-protein mannosyltransferase
MRNKLYKIIFAVGIVAGSVWLGNEMVRSADVGLTILVGLVPAAFCVWIILKDQTDRRFLLRVFLGALSLRWIVAFVIDYKHLQNFFGGDANTFDIVGNALSQAWSGIGSVETTYMTSYIGAGRPGWGMFYFVASVYYLIGHSPLAVQLINCSFGAASCVAVYKIAQILYPSHRVARTAAILTAIAPSMILWSSQMLKDAPIVLCLCMCALYALKLRSEYRLKSVVVLVIFLCCLFALRNYAFYIMFLAIAGSLLFAARQFTPLRMIQGGVLVLIIGVALAYFGAASVSKETFDLKRIQAAREWSAKEANSGFGGDVDISDPNAALSFMPIGVLYVLVAPFPWMINSVRQIITLPELIAWWALFPMLIKGYWFAVRHRLKTSFAICIFTIGLTLAYALYQSNVGTAYRHRAQLYVFFFVFISIGLDLRRAAKLERRKQFAFGGSGVVAQARPFPTPLTSKPVTQRSSISN